MTLCQAVTPHLMKLSKNKVLLSEQRPGLWTSDLTLESINRLELGFNVQQFVFHRESPAPASRSVSWSHVSALVLL